MRVVNAGPEDELDLEEPSAVDQNGNPIPTTVIHSGSKEFLTAGDGKLLDTRPTTVSRMQRKKSQMQNTPLKRPFTLYNSIGVDSIDRSSVVEKGTKEDQLDSPDIPVPEEDGEEDDEDNATSPPPPKIQTDASPPPATLSIKRHTTVQRVIKIFQNNMAVSPTPQTGNVDWGIVAVINGVFQAALLGCLESYVVWSAWKFGNVSWEKKTGGSQFILVYLSLFILAQGILALGVFDAVLISSPKSKPSNLAPKLQAWNKNSMQVLAGAVFNVAIFAYSIIQMDQISAYRNCHQTFSNVWNTNDVGIVYDGSTYTLLPSFNLSSPIKRFSLRSHCPWNLGSSQLIDVEANGTWLNAWKVAQDPFVSGKMADGISHLDRALPVEIAICVVSAIGNIVGSFIAYKAYQGTFKFVSVWMEYLPGASVMKRQMLERYHIFILMLKVNIYFTLGIVAQIVSASYYVQKADYDQQDQLNALLAGANHPELLTKLDSPKAFGTTFILPSAIIAIVVGVLYYTLGWFGIRRASYPLMFIFFAFMVFDMGAVITTMAIVVPDSKYNLTRNALITFCLVQMILTVITLAVGILNIQDFKRGLRTLLETKHAIILDVEKTTKPLPRTVPVLD
ncbi:hypothetical protein HDU97_000305 [Phlyctochytrium planicorne]|nr:hypothetical protein HDU97_000305 [Phlyctochytrium planicorne]